jgi:S-formylglutathione hydrolase FrmB
MMAGPVSLMHGWLPAAIQVVTVAAVIGAVGWRSRRWCAVWLLPLTAFGVLVAAGARWWMNSLGVAGEPAPARLWLWVAATGLASATVVAGWPGSRWFRRNLTVFAASTCLLSTGVTINGWIGYFPTVSIAWDQLTSRPVPGQTDLEGVTALRRNGVRPSTGVVVEVTIPDSASNFAHRSELVYLPPAWFATNPPPPLPAVMMIAGEFHTPADWPRAGDALSTLNTFASTHGGNAPVAVFVDASGSFSVDTECVNGPRGHAADHLTGDVVPYLVDTFAVSAKQANWGVVGFSSGGTCALDLTVMHPNRFHAFLDIAGDLGPNAGAKEQTIDRLFGGDRGAWSTFDPSTVIVGHGNYENVSGLFATAGDDPAAQTLDTLGRSRGISCDVVTLDGHHDWTFAAATFALALPWLASRVGTPGVNPAILPPPSRQAGG